MADVFCGVDPANKPSDRKTLGSNHQKVALVWKLCLEFANEADADAFNKSKDHKMCRNCFAAYEKYHDLFNSIKGKLVKASELLDFTLIPQRRHLEKAVLCQELEHHCHWAEPQKQKYIVNLVSREVTKEISP